MLDQITKNFLRIKYPAVKKELEAHHAEMAEEALPEVGREEYVKALSTAGTGGMKLDEIVRVVHSCTKKDGNWAANRKRTGIWLTQNSADIVKRGQPGVIIKISGANKSKSPSFKLSDEALKQYLASDKQAAADLGEMIDAGQDEKPSAKAGKVKKGEEAHA